MKVEHATDEELLEQLQRYAVQTGTTIGVDHVDGHWRAGLIETDELGEAVFALQAVGPDKTTAIRRLADRVMMRGLQRLAAGLS